MNGPLSLQLPEDIQMTGAGALLVTDDGRYLMQLRDDLDGVRMRGHWGVFGGAMEVGEGPEAALRRELEEELEFTPSGVRWFTQFVYCLYQTGRKFHHKHFFEVPVSEDEIARMVQHEGAGFRLMTQAELMAETFIVPWDAYAVMLHARRETTFGMYDGDVPAFGPGGVSPPA